MLKLYVTTCHSSQCSYLQHSEWKEMPSIAFLLNAKGWKGVLIDEGDVLGCWGVNEGSGEAAPRSGVITGGVRRAKASFINTHLVGWAVLTAMVSQEERAVEDCRGRSHRSSILSMALTMAVSKSSVPPPPRDSEHLPSAFLKQTSLLKLNCQLVFFICTLQEWHTFPHRFCYRKRPVSAEANAAQTPL